MSDSINSKELAAEKIEKALEKIQQAHKLLTSAFREFSNVVHAEKQSIHISDQCDLLKALYVKVSNSLDWGKLDLDPSVKLELETQREANDG